MNKRNFILTSFHMSMTASIKVHGVLRNAKRILEGRGPALSYVCSKFTVPYTKPEESKSQPQSSCHLDEFLWYYNLFLVLTSCHFSEQTDRIIVLSSDLSSTSTFPNKKTSLWILCLCSWSARTPRFQVTIIKQGRQYTYNLTLRRVLATTVAVEK